MTSKPSGPVSHIILQWEIWDVEWQHEDGTSKNRPALVISSSAYNSRNDPIWCVKISSQRHDVPFRVDLSPSDPAFVQAGLSKQSFFYLADLQRVARAGFKRRRGSITSFFGSLILLEIKQASNWSPP